MQLSKYLGDAAGIQYDGVQDNSEVMQGNAGFAGLHIGRFKHGRFDRPMKINHGNIRRLGYEPNNPDYQAVQDALDLGVPFVWVQRVFDGGEGGIVVPPGGQISCDGAINSVTGVNTPLAKPTVFLTGYTMDINGSLRTYNAEIDGDLNEWVAANIPELAVTGNAGEILSNITSEFIRLRYRLEPPDQNQAAISFTGNPTAGEANGWTTVCLAPAEQNVISCDGAEQGAGILITDVNSTYNIEINNAVVTTEPITLTDAVDLFNANKVLLYAIDQGDGKLWVDFTSLDVVANQRIRLTKVIGNHELATGEDVWGAISTNGNDCNICLSPCGEQIPSDGATNTVVFESDNIGSTSAYNLTINCTAFMTDFPANPDESYLLKQVHETDANNYISVTTQIMENGKVKWEIASKSAELIKVGLYPRASSVGFRISDDNSNPTITSPEPDYNFEFSLAPAADEVIPTNRVVLNDLSPVHYDESWDVTINGITYPNLSIPRPSEGQVVVTNGLMDIFYKNLASIYEPLGLSVWWGHPRTCYFQNSSSIPISIMLKPNNAVSDAVADATNNNPSVVKGANRIIQFVLAASG